MINFKKWHFSPVFFQKNNGYLLFEVLIGLVLFAFFMQTSLFLHKTIFILDRFISVHLHALDEAKEQIEIKDKPVQRLNFKKKRTSSYVVDKKVQSTSFALVCNNNKVAHLFHAPQKTKASMNINYQEIIVTKKNAHKTYSITLLGCS
jgi:hypothetical protein